MPDLKLIALGREFDAAKKLRDEFSSVSVALPEDDEIGAFCDNKMGRLNAACDKIAEKIIAAPALTIAGLAVKARVAADIYQRDSSMGIEDRAIRNLIASVSDLML